MGHLKKKHAFVVTVQSPGNGLIRKSKLYRRMRRDYECEVINRGGLLDCFDEEKLLDALGGRSPASTVSNWFHRFLWPTLGFCVLNNAIVGWRKMFDGAVRSIHESARIDS
jgi:hypothetical protein